MVQSQPLWAASLWVILSLILLIVLLVLALRPTLVTIADLLGKIKQQRQVSKQLEDKIFTVQKALANLEAVNDKLYLLEEAAPKEARWSEFADGLAATATESGVTLENILINKIPMTPTEKPGKQELTVVSYMPNGIIPVRFTLGVRGDYDKLRPIVEKLEKKRRIIIIDRVQIEPAKEGGWRMTLQGETGYLPDKYVL